MIDDIEGDVRARRRVRFWLTALVVVGMTAGACGPTSSGATRPTIGSAEATADELALGDASTNVLDPLRPGEDDVDASEQSVDDREEPIGPPLPPLPTAAEILEVVSDIHGPTSDVSGQMNRLLGFPQIATPPAASIGEVRADVRETIDGERFAAITEVMLSADGSIDELVAFYEEELEDQGWVLLRRSGPGSGPDRVERLGYEIPDTPDRRLDLEFVVAPGAGRSRIRVRYVEQTEIGDQATSADDDRADDDSADDDSADGSTESPRRRFEGWIGGLPLPDGGVVTGAGIQSSHGERESLYYSLTVRYDLVAPEQIAASIERALPLDDYTIDPQPSMGETLDTWVYLHHPFFADARVTQHPVDPKKTVATVATVEARVPLP